MDSLTFGYNTGNNRLNMVTDIVSSIETIDIERSQAANNYVYDASGNLVYDAQEGIDSIKWTPDGKVGRVVKNNNTKIEYGYDARGDRVVKAKYISGSLNGITFYIRDANGLVLGIYESDIYEPAVQYKQHTWQIYGAQGHDRFGKVTPKPYLVHEITAPDTTTFRRELRQKFYEHKDHLGNVRMTFSDMKNRTAAGIFYLDSLTVYDYYPYGMLKPGRYFEGLWSRYGFNGMEKDDDIKGKGNSYDFGARVYDPRTIRFYSVDPLYSKYTGWTSFAFAMDNPIAFIDVGGLATFLIIKGRGGENIESPNPGMQKGIDKSAISLKNDIENNPSKYGFNKDEDKVIIADCPSTRLFLDATNTVYESGEIKFMTVFSHGGDYGISLGGEDSDNPDDVARGTTPEIAEEQLDEYDLREINWGTAQYIDAKNFTTDAKITLYGCWLGAVNTDYGMSFAQNLANTLNVNVYAFPTSACFKEVKKNGKWVELYDGTMTRNNDSRKGIVRLLEFKPNSTPPVKEENNYIDQGNSNNSVPEDNSEEEDEGN